MLVTFRVVSESRILSVTTFGRRTLLACTTQNVKSISDVHINWLTMLIWSCAIFFSLFVSTHSLPDVDARIFLLINLESAASIKVSNISTRVIMINLSRSLKRRTFKVNLKIHLGKVFSIPDPPPTGETSTPTPRLFDFKVKTTFITFVNSSVV